jgi:dihydroorotase-like cyclic amidohydrolase
MFPEIFFLPEMIIDSHCHGRDMEQSHKTTVEQVLREAFSALIRITIFQPNTQPPITSVPILMRYLGIIQSAKDKLKIAEKQYLWFGATDSNLCQCQLALKNDFVVGIKIYPIDAAGKSVTTGSLIGVAHDETIVALMKLTRNANKAVAVHCDDPVIIKAEGHSIRAEVEYVKKIIRLAKLVTGVKIIICHVSCRESAELILEAQEQGMQIAMEIMPHYLWFDNEGTNWIPGLHKNFYLCFNNLCASSHRLYLQSLLLLDNLLIWTGSSDHACHVEIEKFQGAGGIPSNQHLVPVNVTLARQLNLPRERVAQLLSWRAADFLGIKVSREYKKYRITSKPDGSILYNGGKVISPWQDSQLLFPESVS